VLTLASVAKEYNTESLSKVS